MGCFLLIGVLKTKFKRVTCRSEGHSTTSHRFLMFLPPSQRRQIKHLRLEHNKIVQVQQFHLSTRKKHIYD